MSEKWIQKALPKSSKGKLHREMGILADKKIPKKKLEKAAKSKGVMGKRARLAETLERFHK